MANFVFMFPLKTAATLDKSAITGGSVGGHEPSNETLDGDVTRGFLPCSCSCGSPL